ncbi:hypothetical protein EDD21DRAFT_393665 [Dissophora ornata]|nr:hypothetical protein EDD21DRAFT_393665 [Dissophora ornata]
MSTVHSTVQKINKGVDQGACQIFFFGDSTKKLCRFTFSQWDDCPRIFISFFTCAPGISPLLSCFSFFSVTFHSFFSLSPPSPPPSPFARPFHLPLLPGLSAQTPDLLPSFHTRSTLCSTAPTTRVAIDYYPLNAHLNLPRVPPPFLLSAALSLLSLSPSLAPKISPHPHTT